MCRRTLSLLPALLLALTWNSSHAQNAAEGSSPPNLLLIIADDLGVESLPSYGIGSPTAVTPNLDRLAARGARFENFWAAPTCSPTRAQIVSGRYAFRTGVRSPIFEHAHLLGLDESPIPPPEGSNKEINFSPLGLVPLGWRVTPEMRARGLPPGLPLSERPLPAVLTGGDSNYVAGGFW